MVTLIPLYATNRYRINALDSGTLLIALEGRGVRIRWRRADWAVETGCAFLLIVSFCWDWKNILRVPDGTGYTGIPNPFAWWLFVPAYLVAAIYFAVRIRQVVAAGKGGPGDGRPA